MEEMIELGLFFSQIMNFRCHFTATHSSGIAVVSTELAGLYGLGERGDEIRVSMQIEAIKRYKIFIGKRKD